MGKIVSIFVFLTVLRTIVFAEIVFHGPFVQYLTNKAEIIVIAKISDIVDSDSKKPYAIGLVSDTWKGNSKNTIHVRVWKKNVDDIPYLMKGENVILFLISDPYNPEIWSIAGQGRGRATIQGKYVIGGFNKKDDIKGSQILLPDGKEKRAAEFWEYKKYVMGYIQQKLSMEMQ
jgi:hypothetical protein